MTDGEISARVELVAARAALTELRHELAELKRENADLRRQLDAATDRVREMVATTR